MNCSSTTSLLAIALGLCGCEAPRTAQRFFDPSADPTDVAVPSFPIDTALSLRERDSSMETAGPRRAAESMGEALPMSELPMIALARQAATASRSASAIAGVESASGSDGAADFRASVDEAVAGGLELGPALDDGAPVPLGNPSVDATVDTPERLALLQGSPELSAPTRPEQAFDRRLSPATVYREVQADRGRLESCARAALRTDPALRGDITVQFLIGSDGRVREVRARTSSADVLRTRVLPCVANAFYGMRFAPPSGSSLVVTYPLDLQPEV